MLPVKSAQPHGNSIHIISVKCLDISVYISVGALDPGYAFIALASLVQCIRSQID
ncbi:hypothetical protein [Tropheryma whipplei]|uniref:Uncharacterized protein n=1 Tax=Tropheryma whipplei (strain Twist) TaxID=203267 RepID=Q83GT3_TROWT|nr:hypothetical protein [Tropheryma whipplei]AAO44260.1 unknown [Tropheryma whipplei str. Twist]MCO8190518.1 hypothetical protein [Tropheryma whipplei]